MELDNPLGRTLPSTFNTQVAVPPVAAPAPAPAFTAEQQANNAGMGAMIAKNRANTVSAGGVVKPMSGSQSNVANAAPVAPVAKSYAQLQGEMMEKNRASLTTPIVTPGQNSAANVAGTNAALQARGTAEGKAGSAAGKVANANGAKTAQAQKVTADLSDPVAVQDIGLKVKQAEAQHATDQLMGQLQAQRLQYTQKLAESKVTGSALNTLLALNNRDSASQLTDLNFKLSQDIGDYLAKKSDARQAADEAAFVSEFNRLVSEGFTQEASDMANMMASLYPDSAYWKQYQNPKMMEILKNSMVPAEMLRKSTQLTATWDLADQMGVDWTNPDSVKGFSPQLMQNLKSVWPPEELTAMSNNWADLDNGAALLDYYKERTGRDYQGDWTNIPEDVRQDAYLRDFINKEAAIKREAIVTEDIGAGLVNVPNMSQASKDRIASSLGQLSKNPEGRIQIAGIDYPASQFEDTVDGAGSIFYTGWFPGDDESYSPEQQNQSKALDMLWLEGVDQVDGNMATTRDQFRNDIIKQAASMGINLNEPQTSASLKALTNYVRANAKKEDTGAWGSPSKWTSVLDENGPIDDSAMVNQVQGIAQQGEEAIRKMSEFLSAQDNPDGTPMFELMDPGSLANSGPKYERVGPEYIEGQGFFGQSTPIKNEYRQWTQPETKWVMMTSGGTQVPVRVSWGQPYYSKSTGQWKADYFVYNPLSPDSANSAGTPVVLQ